MEYLIIASCISNPEKKHYIRTDNLNNASHIVLDYKTRGYKTDIRVIEPKVDVIDKDLNMIEYLYQKYGASQSLGVLYERLKSDKYFLNK